MTDERVVRARRSPSPKPGNDEPGALTAATVDQLRETISSSVPQLLEEYAAATGLANLGAQFQAEVIQAVLSVVALHWDRPKRVRRSVVRKQMEAVEKQASDLVKQLRSFQSAIDELIPLYRSDVLKWLELPLKIEWAGQKLKLERTPSFLAQKFESVSNRAGMYAQMFVDAGGKPPLVQSLAHAFERATGRPAKVTLDSRSKYGGHFLELVETVLPLTRDIAQQFGWQMSHSPSTSARGKFVYEHTRASKSFPRISYDISDAGA